MVPREITSFALALAVAGCSSPVPQPTAPQALVQFHSMPYPEAQPAPVEEAPQFCHLGSDCLELDSRPFGPCLVSGEPCEGEGGFMKAAPAVTIKAEDK